MNNADIQLNIERKEKNIKDKDHVPSSIGYASFFRNNGIEIMFENYITDFINFRGYPNEIKQKRNTLIILTALQIVSSLIGMLILIIRRSFVYIFINLIAFILAICGLNGAIKVNVIYLIVHCIFTTAITGGFFAYQILDLFLASDTTYGDKKRYNDNALLFLFSLPYIFDCFVGIYNYIILKRITDYRSSKNKDKELLKEEISIVNKKYSNEQIDNFISNVDSKLCVICMTENRNTVLNPCGHVLCCEECSKTIFEDKKFSFTDVKCPLCKRKCDSYLKVYLS
jgi:hypothetical protein